jgi:hypothetical protein
MLDLRAATMDMCAEMSSQIAKAQAPAILEAVQLVEAFVFLKWCKG